MQLYSVWFPMFRNWHPKTELSMVELIETWRSLMPYWILQNILDQYLLPKLSTEVENWDPTSDTVPLDSWIHPWLTIMSKDSLLLAGLNFFTVSRL